YLYDLCFRALPCQWVRIIGTLKNSARGFLSFFVIFSLFADYLSQVVYFSPYNAQNNNKGALFNESEPASL
ncbi:hypothetical protein L9G74_17010, partial [Shewanella sp. C32]